jgi:hypothetical protein
MNISDEAGNGMSVRLDEITARLNQATPGPWDSMTEETPDGENIYYTVSQRGAKEYDRLVELADSGMQGRRDAEFIAHAPDDIAYLLGELKKLVHKKGPAGAGG